MKQRMPGLAIAARTSVLTKVNALIAFYLTNAPLRVNAAKGVTGYDQATLIWSRPGRP
jgi:hypothetical protein